MQLSNRQCMIVKMILEADGFVTMNTIAGRLSLSKRTILRELDRLAATRSDICSLLETKSGYGVQFCGDSQQRAWLCVQMESADKSLADLSQNERMLCILSQLLASSEPIKIYSFTRELDVTDATIGSDLNRCERWLQNNDIKLVRKPGVGIYIEGDEWNRRRAMVAMLYQNMGDEPFSAQLYTQPGMALLYDRQKLEALRELIDSAPDVRDVFLSDRSYIAIVVHLYFILQRVMDNAAIEVEDLTKLAGEDEEETKLANRLLELVQHRFGVVVPPGELGYLVTILRSAQGLKKFDDRHREQQARRIADRLMQITESRTGMIIGSNNAFYDALLRHLIPTIMRLNMHLEIRNPLLEDIKKHYSQLYELAKVGVSAIEEELGVTVPESEIGYIAIHLGVALEDRKMHLQRRYKAVICCPSGIISAKLLSLRVEREFSDIAIVDVISTLNLDFDSLRRQGAELIISTVPIRDCPLPCVVVSPFLLDNEKEELRSLLLRCKQLPRPPVVVPEHPHMASSLADSKLVIDNMLDLLNNFFYLEGTELQSAVELVELAAETIGKNDLQQAAIARELFAREEYGSTVTMDGRCMLLHCRTAGISQLHLGVVHLGGAITLATGGTPQAALIMLAPRECPKQVVELLSAVGSATVEYSWFVDALCCGDRERCYAATEQVLAGYYNATVKL